MMYIYALHNKPFNVQINGGVFMKRDMWQVNKLELINTNS